MYFVRILLLLQHDEIETYAGCEVEFIFIRLNVLREYLSRDLAIPDLNFDYDFEVSVRMFSFSIIRQLSSVKLNLIGECNQVPIS